MDAIIARCLKKAPGERFQNVAELVDALVALSPSVKASATRVTRILAARGKSASVADSSGSLPGISASARIVLPPADSQPIVTPSNVREIENATLSAATLIESSAKKKSKMPVVLGAIGGVVALGVILFFALHTSEPKTTVTAQQSATTPATTVTASAPSTTTTTTTVAVTATATASATPSATATHARWRNNNRAHTPPNGTATATGTENVLDDRR